MKKRGRKRRLESCWAFAGTFYGARCPECGERLFDFFAYDADCCPGCDVWLTPRCGDADCTFCAQRPDTPSLALAHAETEARVERLRARKAALQSRYFKRSAGRARRRRTEQARGQYGRSKHE